MAGGKGSRAVAPPLPSWPGPSRSVANRGRLLLNERGFRPTAQRLAVLSLLAASDGSVTVAELSALQRRARPPVSTATLYRTVGLLVTVGLVSRTTAEDGVGRYAPLVEGGGTVNVGSVPAS